MLTHCGTEIINTEHLILRPFKYDDIQDCLKNWIADEKIQSMYAEPVYKTKDEVKILFDKYISSYQNNNYYRWAVIHKESNECIGQIAFFWVDSENHFAEIEYCIGQAFQRKGLATEATKAIVDFGFNKINLHKVQISVKEINPASRRVIEKCGFTYEGTLRDYFFSSGKYISRLYYSLLRSEWKNQR